MQEHARVTVVGAGTMGNGIAHVFAQFGHPVTLIDVDEQRLAAALRTIGGNLDRQIKKGALPEEAKVQTLERLRTATSPSMRPIMRVTGTSRCSWPRASSASVSRCACQPPLDPRIATVSPRTSAPAPRG